jgi:HJR/Mrr/RecB family endonuclease
MARRCSITFWQALDGPGFEREVAGLLRRMGHTVTQLGGCGDEGVDLEMDGDVLIQCKCHKRAVSPAVARDLNGAKHCRGAARAILISAGGFTPACRRWSEAAGLELWDAGTLADLQAKAPATARSRSTGP